MLVSIFDSQTRLYLKPKSGDTLPRQFLYRNNYDN